MLKIISVVGARPNFMKIAPLHRAFSKLDDVRHIIVHTGQHYDNNMSKVFFDDLGLPRPDFYLGVGSGTHAEQTAKVMVEFEKVLFSEKPDLVIVVGDVNSTVACSLTASKLQIHVAHVEAGLRSFDRTMPEELNRIVTDALSDYLFVTEESGVTNLKREGVGYEKIFLVGNVMVDSLMTYLDKARESGIRRELGIQGGNYSLVTMHRPGNVDEVENLRQVVSIIGSIARYGTVVFPVHPRTKKRIEEYGLMPQLRDVKNLVLAGPVGYLDFLNLMMNAKVVLTDSGGIQVETMCLQIPCVTLRETTEHRVTIESGMNVLAGLSTEKVASLVEGCYAGVWKKSPLPELWDGKAAERIAEVLMKSVKGKLSQCQS